LFNKQFLAGVEKSRPVSDGGGSSGGLRTRFSGREFYRAFYVVINILRGLTKKKRKWLTFRNCVLIRRPVVAGIPTANS